MTHHTMRHTAVTNFVRAGGDLPTVQKSSGYEMPTMVQRYAHVHADHIDIATIGRTVAEPQANMGEDTITPDLHKPKLRSV